MNPLLLFALFLKASSLSFGGLGSLPILHQDLVSRGVSENIFGQALAVGRLSPGPNGLYLVSLGYQIGGALGAVASAVALLLPPCTILLVVIWYAKVSHLKRTDNGLMMLGFAITGLLGFTSWQIIAGSATNAIEWAAGGAGFVLSARFHLHPLILIGGAGLLGILIYR